MIKIFRNKKELNLKIKMGNTLLVSGRKKTGEKILLKFAKRLQKSTNKNTKNIIQHAIINVTPTFKLNEQVVKKGKRKAVRVSPSFLVNDSLRLMTSLKSIKRAATKNQKPVQFYEKLVNEFISSFEMKGSAIDAKNELQKQIVFNKRYLSKFRW